MKFSLCYSLRSLGVAIVVGAAMLGAAFGQTNLPLDVTAPTAQKTVTSEPDNGLAEANRIKLLLQHNEVDQALAEAQIEQQKHPDVPLAWYSVGDVLMRLKRWHDAIPNLQKSVDMNPKIGPAWFDLGYCLQRDGQNDQAIDAMTHAIDRTPDLLPAWMELGHCYSVKHDFPAAEDKFEELLKAHPQSGAGWLVLGGVQSFEQLPASALDSFQKAAALRPDLPEAWINLGLAYARDKQPEKALDAFEHAAQARPKYDEALNDIGYTYLSMGQLDKAIESLNAALGANPRHKRALFNIAVAYAKAGKFDLARAKYQALAVIDPGVAANLARQLPDAVTNPGVATAPPKGTNEVVPSAAITPPSSAATALASVPAAWSATAQSAENASATVVKSSSPGPSESSPTTFAPMPPAETSSVPVHAGAGSAVSIAAPSVATNATPVVQTAASSSVPPSMAASVPSPAPATSTNTPAAPPAPLGAQTNAAPSPVAADTTAKADAAVGYTVTPPDPWVKPIDPDAISAPAPAEVAGGIDYLLIDNQQRMDPTASFWHCAMRVTSEEGLESASDIRAEFDPDYQSLVFHQLRVKRDGVWQDRLGSDAFQVLHREENLDSQMLDGRYSVVCHLQDIRVGDVVDYSYTIKGANPAFAGKYVDSFLTTFPRPVHLFSNQLTTAPKRMVNLKGFGGAVDPVRVSNPDGSELVTWKKTEVPAAHMEDRVPGWYDTLGNVEVSEFTSWKQVVDWGLSIFSLDDPPSKELGEKIAEIAQANQAPEDRARAAIDFVQNDVRYLGVEMGANSYRPNPASAVFAHRFGDCKDKTQLAVVMLRALGLEAYPALVSTIHGATTDDLLPSPLAFDHAIVQVTVGERPYWIDVTRTNQRGRLSDLFVDDFKRALLLKPGGDALTKMSSSPESLPHVEVTDLFTVTSMTAPVTLQVHSVFKGHSAETFRSLVQLSTHDELEKNYLAYYARYYPRISASEPLRFQDFPNENRFEIWEKYAIADFWERETPASRWRATFMPFSIADTVGRTVSAQRVAPYRIEYPADVTENLQINLFRPWPLESEPFRLDTSAFSFALTPSRSGNTISYAYHYRALSADIPANDISNYNDQVAKVREKIEHTLTYLPGGDFSAGGDFRPNGLGIAVAAVVFAASVVGAYFIHALRRSRRRRGSSFGYEEYEGIGGWLVLVIMSMAWALIAQSLNLVLISGRIFNLTRWNEYTVVGGSHYDPFHAPTLLFEECFSIVVIVATVLAFVLMFKKRYTYPYVMVGLYVGTAICQIIDHVLASQIVTLHPDPRQFASAIYRLFIAYIIWIPYFLKSKRVKATFRY